MKHILTRNILISHNCGCDEFRVIHTKVFKAYLTFLLEDEGSRNSRVRRSEGMPGGEKRNRRKVWRSLGEGAREEWGVWWVGITFTFSLPSLMC